MVQRFNSVLLHDGFDGFVDDDRPEQGHYKQIL